MSKLPFPTAKARPVCYVCECEIRPAERLKSRKARLGFAPGIVDRIRHDRCPEPQTQRRNHVT